jgi:hypothetical protein
MGQLLRGQDDVSSQVPMPVDRVDDASVANDVAGETLTWLFQSSGAWASATGEAAGTIVTGKLTYSGVLNSAKTAIGHRKDTSFSLGAATRFDTHVAIDDEVLARMQFMSPTDQVTAITPYLPNNGSYIVDHRRGQIWGKSLAIVADDAADYSYATPITGGGSGDKVDLIKVAGTATNVNGGNRDAGTQTVTLADNDPAVTDLAAIEVLNTTIAGDTTSLDAKAPALGTAAMVASSPFTLATDDTQFGAVGEAADVDGNIHGQLRYIGEAVDGLESVAFVDETAFTLGTSSGTPVFGQYTAAGDNVADGETGVLGMTIDRHLHVQTDGYDSGTDSQKVYEVAPLNTAYVAEKTVLTNIAQSTTAYIYYDMAGSRLITLQGVQNGAGSTDTITCTIEATLQDDGTAAASCAYVDITSTFFGVASWVDTDFLAVIDQLTAFKYIRVKYVTNAGGGNDADLTVFSKKMF